MISKNGISLVVMLVEGILKSLGVEFPDGSVAKAVEGTLVMAAFIFMCYHQLMERPEVKGFILKHKV